MTLNPAAYEIAACAGRRIRPSAKQVFRVADTSQGDTFVLGTKTTCIPDNLCGRSILGFEWDRRESCFLENTQDSLRQEETDEGRQFVVRCLVLMTLINWQRKIQLDRSSRTLEMILNNLLLRIPRLPFSSAEILRDEKFLSGESFSLDYFLYFCKIISFDLRVYCARKVCTRNI